MFQPRRVDPLELASWYGYVATVDAVGAEPSDLLGQRVDRLLGEIEPYRRLGTLLDVGCGRGTVAIAAEAAGWTVHATEISASAVAALRPRFGDRIFEGDLFSAPFQIGSFDAVLMIEVLEHLAEPGVYLDRVCQLLRPGGALLVTTPNSKGLSGRLRGARWRVFADEHLTYFDATTLRQILRGRGFASVRIVTTGMDVPFIYSIVRIIGRRDRARPQRASTPARRAPCAQAANTGIELANWVLRRTRLGDSLRAVAERPQ